MTVEPGGDAPSDASGQVPSSPNSIAALTLSWAKYRNLQAWFSRQTTSTNTIAKSRVSSALERSHAPTVFLTERQTAGRGRGENSWLSATDSLLSTWSFPLRFSPQPILSPLLGLALYDACRRAFIDVPFNLKAPNDLYVGDKKIAGLLTETVALGEAVTCMIGLGFNAALAPTALAGQAVGLGQLIDPQTVMAAWPIFLSAWFDGAAQALGDSQVSELKPEARARLLEALNLHPLLQEPILDVGARGELQTATRLIDWQEL